MLKSLLKTFTHTKNVPVQSMLHCLVTGLRLQAISEDGATVQKAEEEANQAQSTPSNSTKIFLQSTHFHANVVLLNPWNKCVIKRTTLTGYIKSPYFIICNQYWMFV